jgi:hypothetical protein
MLMHEFILLICIQYHYSDAPGIYLSIKSIFLSMRHWNVIIGGGYVIIHQYIQDQWCPPIWLYYWWYSVTVDVWNMCSNIVSLYTIIVDGQVSICAEERNKQCNTTQLGHWSILAKTGNVPLISWSSNLSLQ